MADDASFALGFLVGIMIIIGPQLFMYIRGLKKQILFLKPTGDTGESGTAYDKEYPNRREQS